MSTPLVLTARNHFLRPGDVNTLLVDGDHKAELDGNNQLITGTFQMSKESKGGLICIAVNSLAAGVITQIEMLSVALINGAQAFNPVDSFPGLNINAARLWIYQMHWTAVQGLYDGAHQVSPPNAGAIRITQANNTDVINYRVDFQSQD